MSLDFGFTIPFIEHLGVSLERFEDGHATLRLLPRPEHRNSHGVLHGGVVMTLLDVALASAARSVDAAMGVVTIELKTSFMRPAPAQDGQPLTCHARLLHRTRSMAFAEGALHDAAGQLCAQATGTFRYVPAAHAAHGTPTPTPISVGTPTPTD